MKKLTLSIIIPIIAILLLVSTGLPQEKTAISVDQSLKSNGRVNPVSLALEMQIPLAAYPGRGMGLPVGLSYSSKLWRMSSRISYPNSPNPSGCHSVSAAEYSETSASGWTSTLSVPYMEYTGVDNLYNFNGDAADDSV